MNPRRVRSRWILALAMSCAVGGTTALAASELGVNAAKAATARYATRACDNDPQCVKSTARYCDRQSNFKLVCVAFTIKRTATGERVQCRTQVVVTGRPGGPIKANPRQPRCS